MVGVSNATPAQLREPQRIVDVVSVQNRYSIGDREHGDVLDACTASGQPVGSFQNSRFALAELATGAT